MGEREKEKEEEEGPVLFTEGGAYKTIKYESKGGGGGAAMCVYQKTKEKIASFAQHTRLNWKVEHTTFPIISLTFDLIFLNFPPTN